MEEEKVRKLAEFREFLEERVKALEVELEGLKLILEFINNILVERSFKRAAEVAQLTPTKLTEAAPTVASIPSIKEAAKIIPLKSGDGEVLANIYLEDRNIRVIPEPDKKFNVETPPFEAFLINKVLMKMREVDQEAIKRGELIPEDALSFEVKTDEKIIREILIRNVAPKRQRELKSAIRWTLEKMYEKMRESLRT